MDTVTEIDSQRREGGHVRINFLPREHPRDMPLARLDSTARPDRVPRYSRARLTLRRLWIFLGTAALTAIGY